MIGGSRIGCISSTLPHTTSSHCTAFLTAVHRTPADHLCTPPHLTCTPGSQMHCLCTGFLPATLTRTLPACTPLLWVDPLVPGPMGLSSPLSSGWFCGSTFRSPLHCWVTISHCQFTAWGPAVILHTLRLWIWDGTHSSFRFLSLTCSG